MSRFASMPNRSFAQRYSETAWYRWIVFATVVTGTFMVNVDSSVMNVTLPVLEQEFHQGAQTLQWVISAYLLMVTGILPIVGSLSDTLNRKTVFITGVSIFTVGSILCAFSQTVDELILFRVIQSVGGAIIMGNVMSIVSYTFPPGQRGRPLGIVGSVVAVGTIVGPALGGILVAGYGWRSIFWINVPVGVVSVAASIFVLPAIRSKSSTRRFDSLGAGLFFIAIVTLMLLISEGTAWGWTSVPSLVMLAISVVSWAGFIWQEVRSSSPVIELSLFRSGAFVLGNMAGYLSYVMMMFPGILLPLYMHFVLHIPTAHMGLLLTPQAISMVVFSPLGGFLADKFGTRVPAAVGLTVAAVGLGLMAMLGIHATYGEIVTALSVFGMGMGLFTSPNNVSVLESVPIEKSGLTGSLIATVRNFGRVSGVAFAVLLLQISGRNLSASHGFQQASSFAFFVGVGIGFVGVVLTVARLFQHPQKQ